MIYYVSSTGTIIGGTSASDPSSLSGITHIPSGADYAVFIDDVTVSAANPNNLPGTYTMTDIVAGPVYTVPTATGTLTFTEQSAAEQLAVSQSSQLASINAGYNATMAGGFQSNATGTSDTYAIDPVSMGKWTGTLAIINAGIGPSSVTVKDISGNKVTLTASEFKQFALDGFNFFNAQEQQLWALEDEVNAQTSVPSTPVTWTPGSYTPQPAPTTS